MISFNETILNLALNNLTDLLEAILEIGENSNSIKMENRLSEIKVSIEILPIYDGTNKKHLSTFIKTVDKLMLFINALIPPLNDFEKFTITNGILSKIKGKAFESLENTDISSWQNIKATLQNQHLIYKTYATIFNEIIYLNRKDPHELFSIINEKAKEFNDLVRNEFPVDDNITTVFEKILIQNFINKVSDPYGSNLANRQPRTLIELGNLLQNDYQFLKFRQLKNTETNAKPNYQKQIPNYIAPKFQTQYVKPNFPSTSNQNFTHKPFPTGPVQLSNIPRKNFAPRQNIINGRQIRPIPMSMQTNLTYKPMGQNQNYMLEENQNETSSDDYLNLDIEQELYDELEDEYKNSIVKQENSENSFLDENPVNIEEKF